MRMSNVQTTRLAGIGAVNPASVSGVVNIAGQPVTYQNGVLKYGGETYAVSDDHDFVISTKNYPIGAIVNGALIALAQLSTEQLAFFKNKYKF